MPRFPKGFGRRKTILPSEEAVDACPPVVESSFKVFERPNKVENPFDSRSKFRPIPAAAVRSSTIQLDENLFENISSNNTSSSGTSNTLTSVTDNSSRLSATSTVPSFTENSNTFNQEWTSPHDKPFTDIPVPPAPRTPSTFSLKNTGRAVSWGRPRASHNKEKFPPSHNGNDHDKAGARLIGVSNLRSTNNTVPPNSQATESNNSSSGVLSDVFSTFENKTFAAQSTDRKKNLPDTNFLSKPPRLIPATIDTGKMKTVEGYTEPWSPQNSTEGLIEGKSTSTINSDQEKLAVRISSKPMSSDVSTTSRRENTNSSENECAGEAVSRGRHQETDDIKLDDDDTNLLQESINASRRMNAQITDGEVDWTDPHVSSHKENNGRWSTESWEPHNTSSREKLSDDNMFDSTIIARADLALRYQELSISPPKSRSHHSKIMTPAQFERYKLDQERMRNSSGNKDIDDGEEETYEDDEDEDAMEKAKAVARQRRKQEAHMAVYRQQMRKVIGETPGSPGARPSMFISQSSPNLPNFGQTDEMEEEDEEVPLGILQAHGFPSKNKPPIRSMGSNPNLQNVVANSSGEPRLPVFARNLPQDPYYGSGIVKPMHRESMAFAGGSPANNGITKGLPPGGLVGVIATEERSRALRRGSPNPQGEYSSPLPSNSMGPTLANNIEPQRGLINLIGSGIQSPSPNPTNSMMFTSSDQAQIQMTQHVQQIHQLQQMQQFMQMQMQFMQAMTQAGQHPSITAGEIPRPASAHVNQRFLPINQNAAPWMNRVSTYTPSIHVGNGYAPSIAPSERSNIGLPGRYRPVSQAPVMINQSRTASLCANIQGWDRNKNAARASTINLVNNHNIKNDPGSDEDDDEAWAEMAKKKSEKKSLWKNKKEGESIGIKEMLGYLS